MISVLKNRNFRYLWLGGLISTIGDYALYIALPFYIYSLTGSTLATGLMFIVETIPGLFISPFAGVFADRWNTKNIMILSDLIRGIVILLLLTVNSTQYLWMIYVVAFLQSLTSRFFYPAKNKLLPRLVPDDKLISANSLDSMSMDITSLIGPSMGGLLMAIIGITGIVLIDSLSFFISAIFLWRIHDPIVVETSNDNNQSQSLLSKLNVWNDWIDGMRVIGLQSMLMSIFIIMSIIMIGQGIISVLLFVFVQDVLQGGSIEMGWMISAQGIGGILGGLVMARYGNRLLSIYTVIFGFSLTGILLSLMATMTNIFFVVGILPFIGIAVVCAEVAVSTFFQQHAPDKYRGRITSAYRMTKSIAMLGGMGLATLLGDSLGSPILIIIAGILFVLSSFILWIRSSLDRSNSTQSFEKSC